MTHETAFIATIAVGLGLAFVFGLIATRLRLPAILGYLVAGVAVGPSTPGVVADPRLASQLAEVGVILLMFGVGLHFSIRDLLAVRRIAIPGAIGRIIFATGLAAVATRLWGWSWGTGLVFGLALSVASTVVLMRALEDRGGVDSADGRIAVGWLIVEDLVTVLALVLLPPVAGALGGTAAGGAAGASVVAILLVTLAKVIAFVALMLIVGRRVVPWLLGKVVHTGSRELFTLAVLAIALCVAVGAASLFGVSFALGAFFAGVIVSESDFSAEAATNALPLQEAFAVLFFVSVGMLFDPAIVAREPVKLLVVVLIVLLGKSIASFAIVLAFRYPIHSALVISSGLAQIGEFSFILAALGVSLGLLSLEAQSLIVAAALISITLNPFLFRLIEPAERWYRAHPRLLRKLERPAGPIAELPRTVDEERLRDHAVLIGYGRVGAPVGEELALQGVPLVIVEQSRERAEALRESGLPVIYGDATRPEVLADAHVERARLVIVAAPDAFQTRAILELARRLNPKVEVVVRTHSDTEREYLEAHGAERAYFSERELAVSLARHALRHFQVPHEMQEVASRALGYRER